MNPYPLALLNHLTVPFKRSTSSSPLSARLLTPRARETCPPWMHFVAIRMGCQDGKQAVRKPRAKLDLGVRQTPEQCFLGTFSARTYLRLLLEARSVLLAIW